MTTGYGEGSVVKRKDGRWMAVISTNHGKRKYFYGATEREVRKKVRSFRKTEDLLNSDISNVSAKKYFLSWLENDLKRKLKPKSYDTKEYVVNNFIIKEFSMLKVGEISSEDIQDLLNKMFDDGYSFSTIKKVYDAINQRFKLSIERREILFNPAVGVVLPDKKSRPLSDIRYYSDKELMRILDAASAKYPNGTHIYRMGYAIHLLSFTGLRAGEAIALDWNDCDFVNDKIRINKNAVTVRDPITRKGEKTIIQNSTKTDSGNRVIPMSKSAKNALIEISKVQNLNYVDGQNINLQIPVLATSNGTHMGIRNLERMFDKIQERADITNPGTPHSLRHTFATRLIKNGTDIKVVSKTLGHSDVTITYNTYIHVIEDMQIEAMEGIDLSYDK